MLVEFILYTTIATSKYEVFCLTPADEQLFSYRSEHSVRHVPIFHIFFRLNNISFQKLYRDNFLTNFANNCNHKCN